MNSEALPKPIGTVSIIPTEPNWKQPRQPAPRRCRNRARSSRAVEHYWAMGGKGCLTHDPTEPHTPVWTRCQHNDSTSEGERKQAGGGRWVPQAHQNSLYGIVTKKAELHWTWQSLSRQRSASASTWQPSSVVKVLHFSGQQQHTQSALSWTRQTGLERGLGPWAGGQMQIKTVIKLHSHIREQWRAWSNGSIT